MSQDGFGKLLLAAAFLGVSVLCGCATGPKPPPPKSVAALPAYSGPKKLIAVIDFKNNSNYKGQIELGNGMSDMLTDALVRSGRFIIVERQQIQDVLKEQDFSQSGRTVESSAPKIGRLLNAQVLVVGSVVDFSETSSQGPSGLGYGSRGFYDRRGRFHPGEGIGLNFSRAEARVTIAIRLIDSTTGQVLDSQEAKGIASSSAVGLNMYQGMTSFRSAGFAKTPLGQATQKSIDEAVYFICSRMETVPWEGRVVDVNGGNVYINAGQLQGIKEGQQFTVSREGEAMVDPSTGLSLGGPRKEIGIIEVVEVQPKFSIAKPVRGQGFARKDVIRSVAAPASSTPVPASPPVSRR